MTVLRIRLSVPCASRSVGAVRILPTLLDGGAEPLLELLAACRQSPPCPTAPGLCQDAASHPARRVRGWFAWRAGEATPAGLVTLVTATVGTRERHSVGWLLVRPDARRQGVATALVSAAADAVAEAGGSELLAETLTRWPEAAAFWHRLTAADGSCG